MLTRSLKRIVGNRLRRGLSGSLRNKFLYLWTGKYDGDNLLSILYKPNPSKYGYLYNYYAITDARNIANTGWSVPTLANYETMNTYLGGDYAAGIAVTDTSEYWTTPTTWTGTNSAKFNIRPSGFRLSTTGAYSNIGDRVAIWTSTVFSGRVRMMSLRTEDSEFTYYDTDYATGLSLRLLKDSTTLSDGEEGQYIGNDGEIYRTICIGTQEWLADNLIETKYRNGDDIPEVINGATWAGLLTGARCNYDNDLDNSIKSALYANSNIFVTGKDWSSISIPQTTSATFELYDNPIAVAADGIDDFWFDGSDVLQSITHADLIASETVRTFVKYSDFDPYDIYAIGILKDGEILSQADRIALNRYFKLWFQYWGEIMDSGYMKDNRTISEEDPLIVYASPESYLLGYTVADWNTLFNLPTNGTEFTSLINAGDKIYLFGGENITIVDYTLSALPIIEIDDQAGAIVGLGTGVFDSCSVLKSVIFPSVTTIGGSCFANCSLLETCITPAATTAGVGIFNNDISLVNVDLRSLLSVRNGMFSSMTNISSINIGSCTALGTSVLNNSVFNDITGRTIILTIPSSLMTCNGGGPDGDIEYLISNNTVTIEQT